MALFVAVFSLIDNWEKLSDAGNHSYYRYIDIIYLPFRGCSLLTDKSFLPLYIFQAQQCFLHYSTFLDRFENSLTSPVWQLHLRQQIRREAREKGRDRGRVSGEDFQNNRTPLSRFLLASLSSSGWGGAFVPGWGLMGCWPSPGSVCQTSSLLTKDVKEGRAAAPWKLFFPI